VSNTAEALIIGAGVHGASLAFHLAQRGVKALVLEKSFIAAGATGRSSGLVRMHYDVRQDSELAWVSFGYFRNWAERVGGDTSTSLSAGCGFTRTGFLQIVAREDEELLRKNTAMHQDIGIPSLLITADDVKRLAPSFATDDFDLAAYEPESGYADPSSTAASLLNTARERGARLIQDCAVTDVLVEGGKVKGVRTSQGEFFTPMVVNAAGAWAGKLNELVGLDLPYTTWRHDTMFVSRPKEIGLNHPAVIDFPNEMYFRPETGSLTLVGLEDGNPLGESPDSDTDHAKKGFVERSIDRICKRIPLMENGALHSAHGGYDGITPDQHPMLGPAGPEGFYLQCGMSGTGFKIAPAVGLCMSELILDGEAKTVDISIYRPQRFAEGKQVVGEHPYSSIWR
jgi:sarcosine oxidase subunit beta